MNFGEFQGSSTVKDQIHKLSLVLKELKEIKVGLKILDKIKYLKKEDASDLIDEVEQLIAIIATILKNKKDRI